MKKRQFAVGGLSESESTFPGNSIGGFGVKTNALIHPTHKLDSLLNAYLHEFVIKSLIHFFSVPLHTFKFIMILRDFNRLYRVG